MRSPLPPPFDFIVKRIPLRASDARRHLLPTPRLLHVWRDYAQLNATHESSRAGMGGMLSSSESLI